MNKAAAALLLEGAGIHFFDELLSEFNCFPSHITLVVELEQTLESQFVRLIPLKTH